MRKETRRPELTKVCHWLLRAPLVVVTYFVSQTTTRAIKALPDRIEATGLAIESIRLNATESFIELAARNPQAATQ